MQSNSENSIARNIIEVVNGAPKPICTFVYLETKVPGLAEADPSRACTFEFEDNGNSCILWDGMTAAGRDALDIVLREGRVALIPLNVLFYLFHVHCPDDPRWIPMGLVKATQANLSKRGRFLYAPERPLSEFLRRAPAQGDMAQRSRI